jgi:hypothetical protein
LAGTVRVGGVRMRIDGIIKKKHFGKRRQIPIVLGKFDKKPRAATATLARFSTPLCVQYSPQKSSDIYKTNTKQTKRETNPYVQRKKPKSKFQK